MSQTDWPWPHFSRDELKCKCGCDRCEMDITFMERLETIREILNEPLTVNSAYRCPDHNDKVSSTGRDGPHTTGKAVDIAIRGARAHRLLRVAPGLFSGIGVSQKEGARFIHLDTLTGPARPGVWSY